MPAMMMATTRSGVRRPKACNGRNRDGGTLAVEFNSLDAQREACEAYIKNVIAGARRVALARPTNTAGLYSLLVSRRGTRRQ